MRTAEQIKCDIVSRAGSDYKFRTRLLSNPREAAGEVVAMEIPEGIELCVHEESETTYHLVVPPAGRLTESQLDTVAVAAAGGHWFGQTW